MPVLLITGEDDLKFSAIATKMADAIETATQIEISESGHSAHLEQPDATAYVVLDWIGRNS